jgi:hypothetical protein
MLAGGSCAGRHPGGAPTPVTPNQTHGARRWVLVGITSLLYRRLAVFEHGLSIDDALGERLYCVERADGGNMLLRDAHCTPARTPGMTSFSRQPDYPASSPHDAGRQ